MSEKYTEILRLKVMLEQANIPFKFYSKMGGFQIEIYSAKDGRLLCDAIEFKGSMGYEEDLIEIAGALEGTPATPEEKAKYGGATDLEDYIDYYADVLGHLTAEEVFRRFKYCYEHDTRFYKAE